MSQYIICLSGNNWYSLNLSTEEFSESITLHKTNQYLSFQISDFIRYIKSENKKFVPDIIDLESFDKQFSQKGKDILKSGKWHILKSLRREELIGNDYEIDCIESFLKLLKIFYEKLLDEKTEEAKRFKELEVRINRLIHNTEHIGVKIDENIVEEICHELHYYLYKLKNKLQFKHNIYQPENTDIQYKYLKSQNYKLINSVKRTVKLLRKSDELCNDFYEINRTSQDLKSLLYITARYGGKNKIHPHYIGFGSVTSRITIKEPALQNLRRKNRKIIVPEKGKSFFYIDYTQYEAGILANFSNDKGLLDLYNEDDIYEDMVKNIFKKKSSSEDRKLAKILFYRYLYGDDFSNDLKLKKEINDYFNKFQSLEKFKGEIVKNSQNIGMVRSFKGNHRILDETNDNIWILSHYIQSIASYIFKKSLLDVYENEKNVRLIIPLHDGALYQTENDNLLKAKLVVKEIFLKNLKIVCPRLKNPQVTFEDFF